MKWGKEVFSRRIRMQVCVCHFLWAIYECGRCTFFINEQDPKNNSLNKELPYFINEQDQLTVVLGS
jgi:hypothetical protein